MEPVSALALASSVVAFVEFGTRLFNTAKELQESVSGTTAANEQLENVLADLQNICLGLSHPNASSSLSCTPEEKALSDLAISCNTLAQDITSQLNRIKRQGVDNRHRFMLREALGMIWNKKSIQEMLQRINMLRDEIALRLLSISNIRQENLLATLNAISDQHRDSERQAALNVERIRTDLLDAISSLRAEASFSQLNNIQESISKSIQVEELLVLKKNRLLASLYFDRMHTRASVVAETHPSTFEWIFQDSSSTQNSNADHEFTKWLKEGSGCFWITGNVGSGKSTLMKYIVSHDRTKQLLHYWAGNSRKILVADFFFWNSGTELQKSQEGLLRTVLYQVLRQIPELIPIVLCSRWAGAVADEQEISKPWLRYELIKAFETLLSIKKAYSRVCLFIDGLDEYLGDYFELVTLVEKISNSSNLKLCVSSRPWNVFKDAFGEDREKTLWLHELNWKDIHQYASDLLHKNVRSKRRGVGIMNHEDLALKITERSRGVFLWVIFVVRSLCNGLTNKDTVYQLEKRLDALPKDLEDYFQLILNSVEELYHEEAAIIYQTCIAASEPLSLLTLSFILGNVSHSVQVNEPYESWTDHSIDNICYFTQKRINARCKDLLEVRTFNRGDRFGKERKEVDFVHRSVKDFLLLDKLQVELKNRIKMDFEPNTGLCEAFLAQMKLALARFEDPTGLIKRFLGYARIAESSAGSIMSDLLGNLDNMLHQCKYMDFESSMGSHICSNSCWQQQSILNAAVAWGLKNYVQQQLNKEPHLLNDCHNRQLLAVAFYAPVPDFNMIKLLLERGANPKSYQTQQSYQRCLDRHLEQLSVSKNKELSRACHQVVELLILHGVDRNLLAKYKFMNI